MGTSRAWRGQTVGRGPGVRPRGLRREELRGVDEVERVLGGQRQARGLRAGERRAQLPPILEAGEDAREPVAPGRERLRAVLALDGAEVVRVEESAPALLEG